MTLNVVKFVLCLRELGIKDLGFNTRKKLCNLAYLLTLFGVDIGLPLSSFKWYLHSVYHPEVTELNFQIIKESESEQP